MSKASRHNNSNQTVQKFQDWDPIWISGPTPDRPSGLITRGYHINGEDVHPKDILANPDLLRKYGNDPRIIEYASIAGLLDKFREHGIRVRLPKQEVIPAQKVVDNEDRVKNTAIKSSTSTAIRNGRMAKNQTQKEFAVACGIPFSALRRYEACAGSVQPEHLNSIAKYIGSPIPR